MLCPAAVSAAAAAVWLLAALGPGLSPAAAAEDDSEPGFTPCSRCFYRQTPPRGASAAPWLRPLCHRLPGGRAFATLSRPTCDTAVYSAYRLGRGWTEEEEGEDGEGGDVKAAVPALLRRGEDDSDSVSPEDSPVELWDSAVKTLVQSSISPQCGTLGGDLYILSGAGGPGAAEDEDAGCQTGPLWSAVCCDVPEGDGGFSVGMISDEGGERQVSVAELVEILGVPELFSEGCGGTDKAAAAITLGLFSKEYPENVRKTEGDAEDEGDDADSAEWSKSPESSGDKETVEEEERNATSSSTVVYILSTTMSVLKAPLRPIFSRITSFPGQVLYVLQEDLGVLSALPGDTFNLFHLLTSDCLSYMRSAAETLYGIGDRCFCNVYHCTSSMAGELLNSCHTGVTGVGTLAGDTLGIFGGALDNAWWVTKLCGGRLWEWSSGYVGTVASEMGGQTQAVGGGFFRLLWSSGGTVGKILGLIGGIIFGVLDIIFGAFRIGHQLTSDAVGGNPHLWKEQPNSTQTDPASI
uniref:INO80 complex subunit E n=1 Tax=Salarias fasciatus TaxID=181472 RepID=A0A672HJ50_SALFA